MKLFWFMLSIFHPRSSPPQQPTLTEPISYSYAAGGWKNKYIYPPRQSLLASRNRSKGK